MTVTGRTSGETWLVPGAEGFILSGKRTGEGTPVVRPDVFICLETKFNYLSLVFCIVTISATRVSPKGLEFLRIVKKHNARNSDAPAWNSVQTKFSLAYQGRGCAFEGGVFGILIFPFDEPNQKLTGGMTCDLY